MKKHNLGTYLAAEQLLDDNQFTRVGKELYTEKEFEFDSTFGAFEGLFEKVTGCDETVCENTGLDCLMGCWLVCLLDCRLCGNEIVLLMFSSSDSLCQM